MDEPSPCVTQIKLSEIVQAHLMQIASLRRATADALANQNENLAHDLDKEVEREIGEEERAMGALRQHRVEHGC